MRRPRTGSVTKSGVTKAVAQKGCFKWISIKDTPIKTNLTNYIYDIYTKIEINIIIKQSKKGIKNAGEIQFLTHNV